MFKHFMRVLMENLIAEGDGWQKVIVDQRDAPRLPSGIGFLM